MTRPGERPNRSVTYVRRENDGSDDESAGGANVREPVKPKPLPIVGAGAREIPTDELVGVCP